MILKITSSRINVSDSYRAHIVCESLMLDLFHPRQDFLDESD